MSDPIQTPDGDDQAEPDAGSAAGPGGAAIEAARDRLADLDEAPLEDHVEVFEDVHRRLQEGLADLDER